MLCDKQYGFWAHKSSELACHNASRVIFKSFEEGKYALAVFILSANAFNSLDW